MCPNKVSYGCIINRQHLTQERKTEPVQECNSGDSGPVESSEPNGDIFFNPNVFTDFKLGGTEGVRFLNLLDISLFFFF